MMYKLPTLRHLDEYLNNIGSYNFICLLFELIVESKNNLVYSILWGMGEYKTLNDKQILILH